jgi:MauM/NapG family ferredoxin protein
VATRRVTRRDLLTGAGLLAGSWAGALAVDETRRRGPALLRPPGAGSERDFLSACTRCGQCVEACPSQVLHMGRAGKGPSMGTPYFVARTAPCNLCAGFESMRCIDACPTPALAELAKRTEARIGLAVLDKDTCLAWNGVSCRACWHACPFPNDAIRLDFMGRAVVVDDACVGCGLCEHACLTGVPAIVVQRGAPPAAEP